MEIQKSARRWARLAVVASLLVAVVFLYLAWDRIVPWYLALPFFLAPLLPIAAQTRVEELRRNVEDQVRDGAARRAADEEPERHRGE